MDRLKNILEAVRRKSHAPRLTATGHGPRHRSAEEKSQAELERLHEIVRDRKQIAWESDISYHLWELYRSLFRHDSPHSAEYHVPDGEWYDVKILHAGATNGQNRFEFELKGARYRFVDDEEVQGWCENIKNFSLQLYDSEDRCLIEIPMKLRVDREGRNYSIATDGPRAFLPGDWIKNFIDVKLKQQQIRNQEIRAQKHEERLSEIEDLKERFGISD